MIKNVLAVITGLIVNMVLILLIEWAGFYLNPMPVMAKSSEYLSFIATAPASFHLLFLVAYAVGAFGGGTIAAWMSSSNKLTRAMTVGGISMGIGIFNLTTLHHPMWVILCSIFAFLPFAYLGGKLGIRLSRKKSA
jgi:hypothetical protein